MRFRRSVSDTPFAAISLGRLCLIVRAVVRFRAFVATQVADQRRQSHFVNPATSLFTRTLATTPTERGKVERELKRPDDLLPGTSSPRNPEKKCRNRVSTVNAVSDQLRHFQVAEKFRCFQ